MSQFRSVLMAERWAMLHKERQKLMLEKRNQKIDDKIDLISSFMSSCKTGFLLPDAKIKKSIKFLKEHTGNPRVKYGPIQEYVKTHTILFKDIVLIYFDKEGQIVFRDHKD